MTTIITSLIPLALAHGDFEEQFASIQTQVIGQHLTGSAARYFGDETINIHLTLEDQDQVIIGAKTESGEVKVVNTSELANPDVDIYTSEQTLYDILSSDSQITALGSALKEQHITYTAHGLYNKIKYAILISFIK